MVEEKYLGMPFYLIQCFVEKKVKFMLALAGFCLSEMGTILHRLVASVCLTETGIIC